MNRLLRFLDPVFGVALAATLAMLVITAWPVAAAAAEKAVGNGDAATELRSPGDFVALRVNGVDVVVRQGPAAVTVQADRNLLPLLQTRVEDSAHGRTLVVGWQRGSEVQTRSPARVTVLMPVLTSLAVVGSGDVLAETFKVERLAVRVEGSGDVRLKGLSADELALAIRGSGDIQADGRSARLSVNIAGSGDVNAEALQADDVNVGIAGSGDASVRAERQLAVSIAGSGDVVYRGAAVLKQSIAGSGTVTRR